MKNQSMNLYNKTEYKERFVSNQSSEGKGKLVVPQTSTLNTTQKYSIHDNYYVAKQNKEFEKRSIYSSAYFYQGDRNGSLEMSNRHST
jgi:hypothetical protein